jgi:ubiquinone/menaquinone biosynthesis C-methylase UbiE
MNSSPSYAHRKPLEHIVARYDRLARFYRRLEFLFLITPQARRKAVSALDLRPGNVVLEIGAGTGRNLRYLLDAVGATGRVIAIDASPGMLAEARRLVHDRGWQNVELLQQDAAQLEVEVEDEVDGVLFSLSYSVIPDPRPALAAAWECLRPSGRLVVMDLGLTNTAFRGLLKPIATLLDKLAPGDAYSQPWNDLSAYGPVTTERFMLNLYYVCTVQRPVAQPTRS